MDDVRYASGAGLAHADPTATRLGTVVVVLGAHAQVGASGVALALADAAALAGRRVLLIDCADPGRSGLAGICQIEGASVSEGSGRAAIRVASRRLGRAAIEVRRLVGDGSPLTRAAVPQPAEWAATAHGPIDLTVVDVGWDVWCLMTAGEVIGPLAWCLGPPAVTMPVLVVRATVPSVGLAEAATARYHLGQRQVRLAPLRALVVNGAEHWPRPVRGALGYLLQQVAADARFIPTDPRAAVSGWTTDALARGSTTAAGALLGHLGGGFAEGAFPQPNRRFPQPNLRGRRLLRA